MPSRARLRLARSIVCLTIWIDAGWQPCRSARVCRLFWPCRSSTGKRIVICVMV